MFVRVFVCVRARVCVCVMEGKRQTGEKSLISNKESFYKLFVMCRGYIRLKDQVLTVREMYTSSPLMTGGNVTLYNCLGLLPSRETNRSEVLPTQKLHRSRSPLLRTQSYQYESVLSFKP